VILTAPEQLSRARELVEPAIRSSVGRLAPEVHRVAAYHLGFADQNGNPAETGAGKALRPALAFLSAEAARAPAETAVPGAVAVELVHNFSLLHDDVMDQDGERRHRPTAWALFGVGNAIIAGDALLTLAHQVLVEDPTPRRVRADHELSAATARMIAGQGQDLAFESRLDVSVAECLDMMANKTGALLSCASAIGAVLAGADDGLVSALRSFGLHLGLAFQAVDDVLGIWGRPAVTGKPVANDLRQHKKTLPIVTALTSGHPAGARLATLLSNGHLDDPQMLAAVGLIEQAGGKVRAIELADRETVLALEALDATDVDGAARGALQEVVRFVTSRDH